MRNGFEQENQKRGICMLEKNMALAEKLIAYFLLGLMVFSLLPVMYLGIYNHPTGDDYYYGAETRRVWEETGSIKQVLVQAVKGTIYQYKSWQGSYSALLLMHLPPNIFNDWAYRGVTSGILLLLTGAVFYMLKPVLCMFLHGTRYLWLAISSVMILLWVQTVPFQGESFFWYNGSMYYTGYYAITLMFFGIAVRYVMSTRRYHLPLMIFLAVFLAGGNYVSMLPALLLLGIWMVFLLKTKSKCAKGMGVVFITAVLCFLVNVLAPGNQIHKESMWNIAAWKAVLKSLLQGIRYIAGWSNGWLVLGFLVVTPLLWRNYSKTSFQFRYPLIVIGMAYGIFCSMSCPTYYTMNSTGPARVVTIVYYSYMAFAMASYGYLLGYFYRWREKRQLNAKDWTGKIPKTGRQIAERVMVVVLVLILVAGTQGGLGRLPETTFSKSVRLLVNGEAVAYEEEYQERLQVLEEDRLRDVEFAPYEHQPEMLYVGDFNEDPKDETNQKAAEYFQKDSICVKY